RRRCHRRIEQHLPTGAIAQEAYRKYTLTSITCIRDPRVKSRLWTFSDNHSASEINTVETTRTCKSATRKTRKLLDQLVIAVGIPLTRYPPHRSGRALISASGSYLGWVAAKRASG